MKKIWHRNYYAHIIRNQRELEKIPSYTLSNPEIWSQDDEYHNHAIELDTP
jgi:putative transposase